MFKQYAVASEPDTIKNTLYHLLTDEIIDNSLKENGDYLKLLKEHDKTLERCMLAVTANDIEEFDNIFRFIPEKFLTDELYVAAIKSHPSLIRFITDENSPLFELAIETDPRALENVKHTHPSYLELRSKLHKTCVKRENPADFVPVDRDIMDSARYHFNWALKKCRSVILYIPENIEIDPELIPKKIEISKKHNCTGDPCRHLIIFGDTIQFSKLERDVQSLLRFYPITVSGATLIKTLRRFYPNHPTLSEPHFSSFYRTISTRKKPTPKVDVESTTDSDRERVDVESITDSDRERVDVESTTDSER